MNTNRLNPLACVLLLVALMPLAPHARQGSQLARAQQENARALRRYTWKSRTEVRKGGETKSVRLALVRYGADGALQETPLSATPPPDLPSRGIRGLIARKKRDDFVETLASLRALAGSYGELTPDRMQSFISGATLTPEVTARDRLVRLQADSVLRPGDSMTLWVDATTRRQRKAEIRTTLDGKPVRVVSEFRDLPQGPTYAARSVVEYPDKGITLITENFDHERAAR